MGIPTFYGKKNWKRRLLKKSKSKRKRRMKKRKLNKLLIPYHSFLKIQRLVEKCVRTTSNLIEFATTI